MTTYRLFGAIAFKSTLILLSNG